MNEFQKQLLIVFVAAQTLLYIKKAELKAGKVY